MTKIIITGGSGFIGTNLISLLIDKGYDVLNIDIKKPKIQAHEEFWNNVDLCDKAALESTILLFKPDYVIHLGARTDLNGKELIDYSANIDGVKNLLKVLDKLPSIKRVIFASSMYVCQPGYRPLHMEDYKPHTVYGESKVMTEKIIKAHNPQYTWSIIRPTSIWGPYFGEPYNLFFKIVLSKKYFHLGEKACKKTYGYIDNFIYQLMALLEADKDRMDKEVFYLGDPIAYDITEWANEIGEFKGIKIPQLPYGLFKIVAYGGDFLKLFRIKFPMTSFRLKNMTTDNAYDLSPIAKLAPSPPIARKEGTRRTIEWLEQSGSF